MSKTETVIDVSSKTTVTLKCKDCQADYTCEKTIYKDGTSKLSVQHGRCPRCQSLHLTNVRMDKFIAGCKHLGNMTNRLEESEKELLISIAVEHFERMVAKLRKAQEPKAKKTGFDLRQYIGK